MARAPTYRAPVEVVEPGRDFEQGDHPAGWRVLDSVLIALLADPDLPLRAVQRLDSSAGICGKGGADPVPLTVTSLQPRLKQVMDSDPIA